MEELPRFRFHNDPIATEVICQTSNVCDCCGQVRGYEVAAAFYSRERVSSICPWCCASGEAAKKFDGSFNDSLGLDSECSPEDIDEVTHRTPGIVTWQQERWQTHCGTPAVFLDYAGKEEVLKHGQALVDWLRRDADMDDENWEFYFNAMRKDGDVLAYIFRCETCGEVIGFSDCS